MFLFIGAVWFLTGLHMNKATPPAANDAKSYQVTTSTTVNTEHIPPPSAKTSPSVTAGALPTAHDNSLVLVATNAELTLEERTTQIERLEEWSRNEDKQSLTNIIGYLANPDKEVRAAAIEATKQFGSADAIPALKAAAQSADNIEDKLAYLEAAEFLSLPEMEVVPTTLEEAAKLRAEVLARRQAQMQQQNASAHSPSQPPPAQQR